MKLAGHGDANYVVLHCGECPIHHRVRRELRGAVQNIEKLSGNIAFPERLDTLLSEKLARHVPHRAMSQKLESYFDGIERGSEKAGVRNDADGGIVNEKL